MPLLFSLEVAFQYKKATSKYLWQVSVYQIYRHDTHETPEIKLWCHYLNNSHNQKFKFINERFRFR